jgi:hypothetical protein
MKKLLLVYALALGCVGAHADAAGETSWRFVGRAGAGFGGQIMDSGYYVGGRYYELNAGTGSKYAIGADYRLTEKLAMQATVGMEVSEVPAVQGNQWFTRVPVEVVGLYDLSKEFRIGAGVRYSTNSQVVSNGAYVGDAINGRYEPTLGFVVEGQYLFATTERKGSDAQFGISLRYVSESFKKDGKTYSGDHGQATLVLYY